eukprot:7263933-Karenia_brevis.AAC.1
MLLYKFLSHMGHAFTLPLAPVRSRRALTPSHSGSYCHRTLGATTPRTYSPVPPPKQNTAMALTRRILMGVAATSCPHLPTP